jgi:hypothetical protein
VGLGGISGRVMDYLVMENHWFFEFIMGTGQFSLDLRSLASVSALGFGVVERSSRVYCPQYETKKFANASISFLVDVNIP